MASDTRSRNAEVALSDINERVNWFERGVLAPLFYPDFGFDVIELEIIIADQGIDESLALENRDTDTRLQRNTASRRQIDGDREGVVCNDGQDSRIIGAVLWVNFTKMLPTGEAVSERLSNPGCTVFGTGL